MNPLLNNIQISTTNIGVEEIIIAIIGYLIVFTALVVLFYVFKLIPRLIQIQVRRKLKREGKLLNGDLEMEISGEVNAAISAAIYLYFSELHDEESNIITIRSISKAYSPWSSKIYGLRNYRKP